jgi:CHAT domain-containing protein
MRIIGLACAIALSLPFGASPHQTGGLGEIRASEGVFGLRRAFAVARARTTIMSLWSVEDRSTREWMTALYRSRLIERRTTAEAVREASRALLQSRRARSLNTHPFFWAWFVAAGDWR